MGMDMNKMMHQARKMQASMQKTQEELAAKEFTASAGGGVVTAVVTGDLRLRSVTIDPEAVDPDDIEMLQDLIVAAVNEAQQEATDETSKRMDSITGGLNIPGLM